MSANADLVQQALSLYFDDHTACCTEPAQGGINNCTQRVRTPRAGDYILRVYNNGRNSDKVRFEHAILCQLATQKLSFEVPRVLLSKAGKAHELLSDGTEACVFHLIPGTLAGSAGPGLVGAATGELVTALGKVQVDLPSPLPPLFDLYKVHHAASPDSYYRELASNPAFDACRQAADFLAAETKALEARLEQIKSAGLPMQLIHGDLHFDNVLVAEDGSVTGLLDFEFAAMDLRAMEMAIAFSKYIDLPEPMAACEAFAAGFVQHGHLTRPEAQAMPDLMKLRIVSNGVYFIGRAVAKEDTVDRLAVRTEAYAKRLRWIEENSDGIRAMLEARVTDR